MVSETITYFTQETTTKEFLNDVQLRADRNAAISEGQEGCRNCVLTGHLTTWGELVVKCASRSYDSLEAAIDQETVCKNAHKKILAVVDGQAEVYLQDFVD